MKKIILSLLTIFITSITYSQEVDNLYDILTLDTEIESTHLSVKFKNKLPVVKCEVSKFNRKHKSIKKVISKVGDDYRLKLTEFLNKNQFNINYNGDTLLVILHCNTMYPLFPNNVDVVSNQDSIYVYTFMEEYLKEEGVNYNDGIFPIVRKGDTKELIKYVENYGRANVSDNPWTEIYRYIIKNKRIVSCKLWIIPFCYDPERWMRD